MVTEALKLAPSWTGQARRSASQLTMLVVIGCAPLSTLAVAAAPESPWRYR
jgi:hypothetical protein